MNSESKNRTALPTANMESNIGDEPLGAEKAEGFDSRVNITVISYRKRNHDPDGVSVKAVLDGITRLGILRDDSAKEVKSIKFESEISETEKTVIIIEESDNEAKSQDC